MPNWKPSPDNIDRLKQGINHLTNRRALMMEKEYPLTFEQVIKITTPPRLQEFIALGYDSLQTTHHISYELGPDQGLGRRSITRVSLPRAIHYAFNRQLQQSYQEKHPIYFNREGIDDETMAKLKAWTEQAVYERRLARLVTTTVDEFLRHMPDPTMYHIMARWPELKVAFPSATQITWRGSDMWERHSNEVPKNLQRWDWPKFGPEREWRDKNLPRMHLTEETLLSCVSLAPPKEERSYLYGRTLSATLTSWQILGGAPF